MKNQNHMQPIHEVYDGVANANSGQLINFKSPTEESIRLEDIALALSNICRFGGQIHAFYSVAQHTLLVWLLAPDHLKKIALLHDAAEAYVGDVIKPLKHLLGDRYDTYEERFQKVIFKKYGVNPALMEELKQFDLQATEIEFNYFRYHSLALMGRTYEINQLLGHNPPKDQLLSLLRSNFLTVDFFKSISGHE